MSIYDLQKPAVALYKASEELSELISLLIDLTSPSEAFRAGKIIGRLDAAREAIFKAGDFEYMDEFKPPKLMSNASLISAKEAESDGIGKVEF